MKGRIAIEPTLTDVKEYLAGEGYTVENVQLNDQNLNNLSAYDAVVVSGMNINLLGIQNTATKALVINADGLTPPEVAQRINSLQ